MKANTHPTYHTDAQVRCTCGNTFTTGSTQDKITVDICASCHPFFTGEIRYVDLAGRVDKFAAKLEKAKDLSTQSSKKSKSKQQSEQSAQQQQTLKEMLQNAKTHVQKSS